MIFYVHIRIYRLKNLVFVNIFMKEKEVFNHSYENLKQGKHNLWFTDESIDYVLSEISNSN